MNQRPRQDDKAENKQIAFFGLTPGPGRSNKYIEDATIKINDSVYKLELKSSSTKKSGFSTSSRMGELKIKAWKQTVHCFIFSVFDDVGSFIEHWFLTHDNMEKWYKRIIKKQYDGHAGRAGLGTYLRAKPILKANGWTDQELLEEEKSKRFGSRLNDPQVSLKYIREHGTKINNKADLIKLLGGINV